eukprot:6172441-Pleurochrysis_carterae.AAC.1
MVRKSCCRDSSFSREKSSICVQNAFFAKRTSLISASSRTISRSSPHAGAAAKKRRASSCVWGELRSRGDLNNWPGLIADYTRKTIVVMSGTLLRNVLDMSRTYQSSVRRRLRRRQNAQSASRTSAEVRYFNMLVSGLASFACRQDARYKCVR